MTPESLERKLDPDRAEMLDTFVHLDLVEEDNENMETGWHRSCMELLIASILFRFRDRSDFYVGGNMFIYFSLEQVRNRDFRGPDFFFVNGVSLHPPRRYWAVWDEGGRYPDVIIELLSRTTAETDRTTKKDVYEKTFRTPNYFCYDPTTRKLEGWEFRGNVYEPLQPNERGWLWSSVLRLWVGTWEGTYHRQQGTWLRFFDEAGQVVLIADETERQRADEQQRRADEQQKRAEAAEAELARLRELLAGSGGPGQPPPA